MLWFVLVAFMVMLFVATYNTMLFSVIFGWHHWSSSEPHTDGSKGPVRCWKCEICGVKAYDPDRDHPIIVVGEKRRVLSCKEELFCRDIKDY